jgi:hypothetical protein
MKLPPCSTLSEPRNGHLRGLPSGYPRSSSPVTSSSLPQTCLSHPSPLVNAAFSIPIPLIILT